MAARKTHRPPEPVTLYAFVGNIGCIRFPKPIRAASGIKRGDRLAINVLAPDTIRLEKLDQPVQADQEALVEGCACMNPPEACRQGDRDVTTVGWSYVQLSEPLAWRLGLLPNTPIKLVGEPAQITVSLHPELEDLEGVPLTICPP
jgi:bifunctional DNA-binding transcriptional regulator/antitoxin component of YhaV-PrlF toxin-antitoxin module